jgi:dihydrofolate reductase
MGLMGVVMSNLSSHSPPLSLVVAVARNGVIGEHNGLPWKLPSELKRFRQITTGHPCIMGRKTWDSIGKPLKNRDNIVLTRGAPIPVEGVITVGTLEAALASATACAAARGAKEIMIIGGGEIYRQTLAIASRLYLTRVDMDATGDTTFPELSPADWTETAREPHAPGPSDSCGYVVHTLDRRQPA